MTVGRIAAVSPSATTNTLIYTVPARSAATPFDATVNICNRNSSNVVVRFAVVDGGVSELVAADWIEYDVTVRAGGGIEKENIKMTQGQSIIGYSDTSNVNFQVWA